MKERNLKDELDQIPQPFDKDALWERIAEEKPRRRRLVFWYWLVFAVVVFGFIALVWNQENDVEPTATASIAISDTDKEMSINTSADTAVENNSIAIENQSTSLAQNLKNLAAPNIVKIESSQKNNLSNETANNLIKTSSKENSWQLSTQEKYTTYAGSISNTEPSSFITNEPISLIDVIGESIKVQTVVNPNYTIGRHIEQIGYVPVLSSGELQLPIKFLTARYTFMDVLEKLPASNDRLWILAFGGNYGLEKHHFAKDIPIGSETELEAIGMNIQVGRKIGKWRLGLGLNHVRGNTILAHNTSMTNFVPSLIRAIRETESTSYKLYNSYSRTDVFVRGSYGLSLSSGFELRPSIGFGTNICSSAHGDYFSSSGEVQDLSKSINYKEGLGLFGSAGLSLAYSIHNNFSLSGGVSIETKRSYHTEHSIRPLSFGLGASYIW